MGLAINDWLDSPLGMEIDPCHGQLPCLCHLLYVSPPRPDHYFSVDDLRSVHCTVFLSIFLTHSVCFSLCNPLLRGLDAVKHDPEPKADGKDGTRGGALSRR
jgi:hypothetical protein